MEKDRYFICTNGLIAMSLVFPASAIRHQTRSSCCRCPMTRSIMVTDNHINMKKLFIITGIIVALFAACKKAAYMPYHSSDNIYFNFDDDNTTDRDSIVYTFAYTPGKESDTLWLPVRISGIRTDGDRTYKVAVTDSGTTAKAGTHYAALQPQYTIPAHTGIDSFPLVIYNT